MAFEAELDMESESDEIDSPDTSTAKSGLPRGPPTASPSTVAQDTAPLDVRLTCSVMTRDRKRRLNMDAAGEDAV